jgi:molybdenum cofactor biosynthesis enzyme
MSEERLGYVFEEIGDDLLRPPMAALRALQSVGVIVAPKGWLAIDLGARRTLSLEGSRDRVDMMVVREIINQVPANQIKLVSRVVDPDPSRLPDELAKVLGPSRPIAVEEWGKLRPLDRFMLTSLSYNTRLLWRALDELVQENRMPRRRVRPWSGAVATCEIRMRSDVMATLLSSEFLDGRAFVLARGSGRRAARKASELFDLQSELSMGPIELDWGASDTPGTMFWQAHASSWDGSFSPAASLAAAVNAAVAILDMLKELDPKVMISRAGIVEEAWVVGQDGAVDATTKVFSKPRPATPDAPRNSPVPTATVPFATDTIVDASPAWAAAAREPEKASPPARPSAPPDRARASSPLLVVDKPPEPAPSAGKSLIRISPDAEGNSAFSPATRLPPKTSTPLPAPDAPRRAEPDPVILPMKGKNPWFWVSILLLVGLTGPVAFLVYERLSRGP